MKLAAPPVHVLEAALERGRDAMSFLAVESDMLHWVDGPPPAGTGALVGYVDTTRAWVAACSPLVACEGDPDGEIARASLRFIDAARAAGRRACFCGSEAAPADGLSRLLIGEQPVFRPTDWVAGLSRHGRRREQLRRARAKGLTVRSVEAGELAEGTELRGRVEELADGWLRARHIEPMGFLVALEPFRAAEEHRYLVAERGGVAVAFLSAVPIGRRGWLVEDVVRDRAAPNGTTESLLAALMAGMNASERVTLGLTPLTGPVALPLRFARWVSRPLFDFQGLRAFRERLHPHAWEPVWLVHPAGSSPVVAVVDTLDAFARGALVGFAVRSLLRHPSGLPWALALPLPLWTAALAALLAMRRAPMLGFPPLELALWVAFDALLLLVLVRAAMRPSRGVLLATTSFAALDAALSVGHLAWVGLGSGAAQGALRGVATIAPLVGTALLAWATTRTTAGTPGR